MSLSAGFWDFIAYCIYAALLVDALWGAYCIVVVFMRIGQKRFRNERQQDEFLDSVDTALRKGDYDSIVMEHEGDPRALAQLAVLAAANRKLPPEQMQELLVDRFQRDVLADFEHRVSWINNVVKTAPMLGLLGTVLGMMGAFGKLANSESKVEVTALAENISLALITTAVGLAIAIPATIAVASINVRIRKLEDLVGAGLVRLLDSFAAARGRSGRSG